MFFLYNCLWNSLGKCLNKVFVSSGGSRPSDKLGGPGRPDPEIGRGGGVGFGGGAGSPKKFLSALWASVCFRIGSWKNI